MSGTTVTIDGPLLHSYATTAATVACELDPIVELEIRNLILTSTKALTIWARDILLDKVQSVRLANIRTKDSGGGIYLNDALRCPRQNRN